MQELLAEVWPWGKWLVAISVVTFLAGAIAVPWLAVRMPTDYLVRRARRKEDKYQRTPAQWVGFVLKNLAGAVIVLAGILMLGAPGPGWGAILLGLALMSFPGKKRLERRLLSSRVVIAPLNAIRAKAHKPPLEIPPHPKQRER